jgi:hypothetical protein
MKTKTITAKGETLPVRTTPAGEEYVQVRDTRTGGRVALSAAGAALFSREGSEYPLPPNVEAILPATVMDPDSPFFALCEEDARQRLRQVLHAMLEYERSQVA